MEKNVHSNILCSNLDLYEIAFPSISSKLFRIYAVIDLILSLMIRFYSDRMKLVTYSAHS